MGLGVFGEEEERVQRQFFKWECIFTFPCFVSRFPPPLERGGESVLSGTQQTA